MHRYLIQRKIVGLSELKIGNKAGEVLVTYSLGSCLAVVVYDRMQRQAGLLHVMLPDSGIEKLSKSSAAFNPFKYVDTGVSELFRRLYRRGAEKNNLCVGVFGGAKVFAGDDFFNIGKRNYVALRKVLWKEGILITHEHVGSNVHRTVKVDIDNGIITVDVNNKEMITYHCL